MPEPLLTIATPVLNGRATLERCLRSVHQLSMLRPGRVRHVVADGGSTDGTLELCREWRDRGDTPLAEIIEGPDRSQSHAINRVLDGAPTPWVGWLNADDALRPRAFASMLDRLEATDAGVVVGRCVFVDESGRIVFRPSPPDPVTADALVRPLSMWFAGRCIVQPEAVVRSSAWRSVGGLDEQNHLAMDHDLWLRLAEQGVGFAHHEQIVAEQHVHKGQKTADNLGVARAILQNGEAYRSRAREPISAESEAELAVLRTRIAQADSIIGATSGTSPLDPQAARRSAHRLLARLKPGPGPVLAVGSYAREAVAAAGWPASRTVLGTGRPWPAAAFRCVVAEVHGVRDLDAAMHAVAPGGSAVLLGVPIAQWLDLLISSARREVGDRVTWRSDPWDDAGLRKLRGLMGGLTASRRRAADLSLIRSAETVERILPDSRRLSPLSQRVAKGQPIAASIILRKESSPRV